MLEDIDHLFLLLEDYMNPLQACKGIINKLLMSVDENLNVDDKSSNSWSNALSSLELLSKLYLKSFRERRCEENFENLDVVVLCKKLSTLGVQSEDENITKKILEIFQNFLKIVFLSNDSNQIINLTNFYIHNINLLEKLQTKENLKKSEITFIVKLLVTFYTVLVDISKDKISHEQISNFNKLLSQSNPNVNECEVFFNLIFSNTSINLVQMILQLIIKYHNYRGRRDLFKLLMDKILTYFESEKNDKLEEILLILCGLSESNFLDLISNSEDAYFILDNAYFWQFIQLPLLHKSSFVRKQGIYLFKKTLNLFDSYNTDCSKKLENSVDSLKKKDLEDSVIKVESYKDILTILEFLEEQQFHIVEPIFDKICDFLKIFAFFNKTEKDKGIWVALIYKRAFMHENIKVTKLALESLITIPKVYFTDDSTVKRILKVLMQAINNIDLYYADGRAISKKLINIFDSVIVCGHIFCVLLKEMCNCIWSPEALFFVSYALAKIKHSVWKAEEICELTRFVSKAFETYNKTIKLAIQNHFAECTINQTNVAFVSLDKIVLLLSKLCINEFFPEKIVKIKNWLMTNFMKEEAEMLIHMLQKDELPKEFNSEAIGFMCFFFYYTFGSGNSDSPLGDCFVSEYLIQTFSSFEDLNKRLYLSEASCERNLLIVSCIMKTCTNHWGGVFDTFKLRKLIVPFLKPIKKFILCQIKLCKTLEDYDLCQLMIKIVKLSSKIELSLNIPFDLYVTETVQNFLIPHFLSHEQFPYMQAYCGLKILQVEIQNADCLSSLNDNNKLLPYLEKNLNTPLKKEKVTSKDIQILWGKLNSKYIKTKWILFETFVVEFGIYELENGSAKKIASLCFDGFNVGGCGILCPVMRTMKLFIYLLNDHEEVEKFINFLWSSINERRKTKNFKVYVQLFVELVFQNKDSLDRPELISVLMRYSNLLFEDSSIAVANILMQHMYLQKFSPAFTDVITNVFLKGLTYGFIMRKDKKLENEIISFIKSKNTCPLDDYITSSEVRAKAVVGILNPPTYFKKKDLAKSLVKVYTEINQNKNRYFGNSLVHKVKLRIMQALLVMKIFELKEISDFVMDCIENENSQPSVRYMQEWYLTFVKDSLKIVQDKLMTREAKPKTICSLLSIFYHLCILGYSSSENLWILMPFSMDQHFEVRLYSRVLIMQLFNKNLLSSGFSAIKNMFSWESIKRETRGNESKIFQKLNNNFFLSVFHCSKDFSLETIFMDLPRLSNVGSEEWISPEVFKKLGQKLPIPIKNAGPHLRSLVSEPWLSEKCHGDFSSNVDETSELLLNYQKKIVPDYDRNLPTSCRSHITNARGSLIVVASLIDRIPNLGGLARTCEIFDVSELVINSLKHVESKEFTSLSVTAEKWINIKEVKAQNLQEYLVTMKKSGYTIIGAEQTTQSKPLNCVEFPKKSLLLLGNEKKGIPPNLLPFLDICVEIPQKGIIRSLNVHVSGALFIWEFAKQNFFSS